MKKIFTLIAAVLCAVCVNAEEVDITSNFTYTWNENESLVNNEDGSITFNSVSWGGMAAWVATKDEADQDVPADWSGYSKVVFEFAEATTVNTQILVGEASAWGNPGITSLECSFAGKNMGAINQIALQTSDPTTIVVKRVYLVTKDGSEAPVDESKQDIDFKGIGSYDAAKGAFVLAAGGAGWHSKWFGTLDVKDWNTLVIEVASTNGDVQFLAQGDKADGSQENLMITASDAPQKYIFDLTGWTNISQVAFQNFNFPDPSIEDWATKEATALETTMVVTAMYLSKEAAPAEAKTLYSWTGAEAGATEVGGKAVASDGESVNYLNAGADGTEYYTIRVNKKKADVESEFVEITLDEALEADDQLVITAYRNKDTDANGTLYIQFANGAVIDEGDEVVWNNVYLGQQPNTNTYAVGEGAGSKSFKLVRSKASTNVFITEIKITRGGATGIEAVKAMKVIPVNNFIYNLAGQRVDANYKGVVIKNGQKFLQK